MMKKTDVSVFLLLIVMTSFGIGYALAIIYHNSQLGARQQKPVVGMEEKRDIINEDTHIVYEQEFQECGHIIISDFSQREAVLGKNLEEIKNIYNPDAGYQVSLKDNTLVIREVINDWCATDKEKYRLKDFNGSVAVYKGPDPLNDVLIKVTSIQMNRLPIDIQNAIDRGEYEYSSEEALNDALENLDEYN